MVKKIEKIVVKFITKQASAEDLDVLSEWIKPTENKKIFIDYVQTHYAINYSMNNPDSTEALERLLKTIKKEKSFRYRLIKQPLYKYAVVAVLAGIMLSTYLFKDKIFQNKTSHDPSIIVNNSIEPGTNKAILTLGDGSQITLEKDATIQTENAISNSKKIIYKDVKTGNKAKVFNYLTIPRGGEFFIKLSDGTEVWLNSDSKLKYPVNFREGETRQVELVYGEAYFHVSPSTAHKGAKFKVINQFQEVEVIGTEFNIKAYKDENNIYTTLVEGKVAVTIDNKKQKLIPNQQLSLNTKTNISNFKSVDVFNEISWKNGVFSFDEKSLKEIMRVLSRWYDIEVVFKNKAIENEPFVGILRKNQKIEDILTSIKNFGVIKNFTINKKKVTLE